MRLGAKVPFYIALLIAGISVGVNVRYNGFVPIFTDPTGYVWSGQRWSEGNLYQPDHFQFLPQFPAHQTMGSPLGFRPGGIAGTSVVEYPPGMGIFIAVGIGVMGELGAHVVVPLFAGVLALATFGLGAALAGPWAGVIAALLVSASPITIRHSLFVNSDVPTTALWGVAWLMSLRPRMGAAAAAGAAVTAATMIRPNTAPLVLVVGLLVLIGGDTPRLSPRQWQWRHAAVFAALCLPGPLIVLWSNAAQYGSPFDFSYRAAGEFFRWAHVKPNLELYPRWLIETHSMVAFLGFAGVPVALWRAWNNPAAKKATTVALSALAIIVLNYGLYLPYINFEQWTYLRFVLPAIVALFVLLAGLVVWTAEWLAKASRFLVPLALVPAALVVWKGAPLVRDAVHEWPTGQSILLMGHYLREALPRDAIVLCFMHCGPVAYYTGKPIIRLDLVQPEFDSVIARVQRQRFRAIVILDEVIETRERLALYFPGSTYTRLDWTPRGAFKGVGRIWYIDAADRELHRAKAYYPVDVLPQP